MERKQTTFEDASLAYEWSNEFGYCQSFAACKQISIYLLGMMPVTSILGSKGNARGSKDISSFLGSDMYSRSFSIYGRKISGGLGTCTINVHILG